MEEKMEEKLKEIFGYINTWLHFAEAKNGALIALTGGCIFVLAGYDKIDNKVLHLALYLFLFLSFFCALLSFYPNLSNSRIDKVSVVLVKIIKIFDRNASDFNPSNIKIFYADIAEKYINNNGILLAKDYIIDIYQSYYKTTKKEEEITEMEEDYSKEIIINSRITVNKYIFFKASLIYLIIFLSIFSVHTAWNIWDRDEREVIPNRLVMRNLPDIKSEKIGTLDRGDKIEVIKEKDGWIKVKTKNEEGWVYKIYVD